MDLFVLRQHQGGESETSGVQESIMDEDLVAWIGLNKAIGVDGPSVGGKVGSRYVLLDRLGLGR